MSRIKEKLTRASLLSQLSQNCIPHCTTLQSRVTVDLRLVLVDVKRLPNPPLNLPTGMIYYQSPSRCGLPSK